jgi:hypothetical protein
VDALHSADLGDSIEAPEKSTIPFEGRIRKMLAAPVFGTFTEPGLEKQA